MAKKLGLYLLVLGLLAGRLDYDGVACFRPVTRFQVTWGMAFVFSLMKELRSSYTAVMTNGLLYFHLLRIV